MPTVYNDNGHSPPKVSNIGFGVECSNWDGVNGTVLSLFNFFQIRDNCPSIDTEFPRYLRFGHPFFVVEKSYLLSPFRLLLLPLGERVLRTLETIFLLQRHFGTPPY